jgi:hypothetical protein
VVIKKIVFDMRVAEPINEYIFYDFLGVGLSNVRKKE